jgi:mRNA (guanine-N7-)-methyltransferase
VTNRWNVLRTRYDKTYQLRVKGEPQFGNDIWTAEDIWTNIHIPITEEMLRAVATAPVDDTAEDSLYYKDTLESRDRAMKDVQEFHSSIKKDLYKRYVKKGSTLLELAVGRGGDLHKWKLVSPSKVVGIDLSEQNLVAPRQGACVRYLQTQRDSPKESMPPALFIPADMTQPLATQDHRYLRLLLGKESPSTPYLEKFAGLQTFDVISCQFAIHYACGSEETFRTFVGNLTAHGKGLFIGTCMDGQ